MNKYKEMQGTDVDVDVDLHFLFMTATFDVAESPLHTLLHFYICISFSNVRTIYTVIRQNFLACYLKHVGSSKKA